MCLAVPGRVVSIHEDEHLGLRRGRVDFSGIRIEVSLDYTPEARVGDYVLVHVGFALSVVDEEEAYRIFEALRELDELEELKESGANEVSG
jgi:hydrogenase expression/formation protein HypC